MKDYVIWLDSKNALIFEMKVTGIEKSEVKKSDKDLHRRHRNDQRRDSNTEHYFRDLATRVKGADQMLLLGPGVAKHHFKDHLLAHREKTLAKKIIGLENFESFGHKTEKQMLASARKFFKTYNSLNNPI